MSRPVAMLSIVLVLVCGSAEFQPPQWVGLEFQKYLTRFEKQYHSVEEYEKRLHNFQNSLARISKQNEEHGTPIFGLTKFSDWSREEVDSILKSPRNRREQKRKAAAKRKVKTWDGECYACVRFPSMKNAETPDSWDWRKHNVLTKVKDQGECGDCFAFGATGDIESAWFLANNSLISLSEQQITSCDRNRDDAGCRGSGTDLDTFQYVINTGGLVSEKQYPQLYKTYHYGLSGKCNDSLVHDFSASISDKLQVSGGDLYDIDEDKVKEALFHAGPMAIGINSKYLDDYDNGIMYYSKKKCKIGMDDLDHEVLITGYGDEAGHPYWLIRNSWGADWGEDGYFRIFRGSNTCGVVSDVVKSVV